MTGDLLDMLTPARFSDCGENWSTTDCICALPQGHAAAHKCICGWQRPLHTGNHDCPRCDGGHWGDVETATPCSAPAIPGEGEK